MWSKKKFWDCKIVVLNFGLQKNGITGDWYITKKEWEITPTLLIVDL
jgi:hypothetical protein